MKSLLLVISGCSAAYKKARVSKDFGENRPHSGTEVATVV